MKKIITTLFLSFFLILGLCSCDKKETSQIVIGVCADYPPFEFVQKGELLGFDIDFGHAIGKIMQKKVVFKDMHFDTLIPSLQAGRIDMAISSLAKTPEREKNILFSEEYYRNILAFVYKKDAFEDDIKNLQGKKIGVQTGSTMEIWVKKHHKEAIIISLPTNLLLLEELKLGRIDRMVVEEIQALSITRKNPLLSYETLGESTQGYGVALAKDSELIKEVNDAILLMIESDEMKKIKDKWINASD